jgi:hypothetical protein
MTIIYPINHSTSNYSTRSVIRAYPQTDPKQGVEFTRCIEHKNVAASGQYGNLRNFYEIITQM